MNRQVLQFALRETREHLSHPRVLIGMAAVAIVLGITAPFDTEGALRLIPRFLYWGAICLITYSAGYFVTSFIDFGRDKRNWSKSSPPSARKRSAWAATTSTPQTL